MTTDESIIEHYDPLDSATVDCPYAFHGALRAQGGVHHGLQHLYLKSKQRV